MVAAYNQHHYNLNNQPARQAGRLAAMERRLPSLADGSEYCLPYSYYHQATRCVPPSSQSSSHPLRRLAIVGHTKSIPPIPHPSLVARLISINIITVTQTEHTNTRAPNIYARNLGSGEFPRYTVGLAVFGCHKRERRSTINENHKSDKEQSRVN